MLYKNEGYELLHGSINNYIFYIWRDSSVGRANGSYPFGRGSESLSRYNKLTKMIQWLAEQDASYFLSVKN